MINISKRTTRHLMPVTSPFRLLLIIVLSVCSIEILIMFFLEKLNLTLWISAIIDALLISVVMFGMLFRFLFQPLMYQITERKHALKALRANEERYRSIFRNIQDVYYELTLDGVFLEISPSIKYLSDGLYHRKDLLGKSIYELCADEAEHEEFLKVLMTSGSAIDSEFTLKNKDGTLIPCSISAKLYCDSSEKPLKITGSLHNISRRKQIEAELRRKNEELNSLNVQKDKIFSIISHDLRSPFNAFLGITGLMCDKENKYSLDEFRKFAGMLNKSARNFYQLLENLLQWAQLKRNNLVLNKRKLILHTITNYCTESLQETANSKQISLISRIPRSLSVLADEVMLKSILMNLISNALKFTGRNGKIVLNAQAGENKDIEISVEDTGIGMSQEMVDTLFQQDLKTTRPGTEGEPSTGLGLIISKEFVEKNGGSLWVKSQVNKGTTFYFTLPKAD